MTRLLMAQQRIELQLNTVEATCLGRAAGSNLQSAMQSSSRMISAPAIQISASMFHFPCKDNCTCVCHRRRTWRTPRLLDKLLGTLFLGYAGFPYVTPQCDNEKCIQRLSLTGLITYLFPSWLLARAVVLASRLSSTNGLEFSLRIPRVISATAPIWNFCQVGDIDGVKGLFQQGLASPLDVGCWNGFTPLTVSMD